METGNHVQLGIPVCKLHKHQSWEYANLYRATVAASDFAPISCRLRSTRKSTANENCERSTARYLTPPIEDISSSDSSLSTSSKINTQNGFESVEAKGKFWEWIDVLGLPFLSSRKPFSNLNRRSQRRKALSTKNLVCTIFEYIAPGNAKNLIHMAFDNENDEWVSVRAEMFEDLMKTIAGEFRRGESREERMKILALVAGTLNFQIIGKYIPGLSKRMYYDAKKYSETFDHNEYLLSPLHRQRYDPVLVTEFVDFITGPLIRTDLPYGRKTLKKSDGSSIDVPNTLRIVRSMEIIEMFIKFKFETEPDGNTLSRASMYRILSACKATTRHSMECVDFYIAEASEAFDSVAEVINNLLKQQKIDDKTAKGLQTRFENVKLYLKSDYKMHVKMSSRISDHCVTHALSDPNDKRFNSSCSEGPESHIHDLYCDRCELMRITFDDLFDFLKDLIQDAEKVTLKNDNAENKKNEFVLKGYLNDVKDAREKIESLKKHVLRDRHAQHVRSKIVNDLQKGQVLLTLDWAQKFLPRQSKEPQSDYYGKTGISVHAIHCLTKENDNTIKQHSFVHVSQQDQQDTATVLMIIEHVLTELKKMEITKVHLRSDNAVCYHSTELLISLPSIASRTGVSIESMTFSEPQGGKGSADRIINEAKTKIRQFVASKNNAETPEQLFVGLTTGRVPKAMSTYLMRVDFESLQRTKKRIDQVSKFYDFRFEKSQITVRKYGGIGDGWKINSLKYEATRGSYIIEKSGGCLPEETEREFWKTSVQTADGELEPKNTKHVVSMIDFDDFEDGNPMPMDETVFQCPIDGCLKKYFSIGNLERHLEIGNHDIHPERLTMLDVAMNRYASNLEGYGEEVAAIVKDAIDSIPKESFFVYETGWAISERKSNARYTEEMVNFVKERLDRAIKTHSKILPKVISQEMKDKKKDDGITPYFKPEEVLNYKQVLSIYSKMGPKRRLLESQKSVRSRRSNAIEQKLVKALTDELNDMEYDDYAETFDTYVSHDTHFDNVMEQLKPELNLIFENDE